jgi:RimJ/RimL family protein N-acetyltransferase
LSTIYVETDRLILHALEKKELPRFVELLDVWDIVRWLAVVPYPYTMQHALDFYADMEIAATSGAPQFYAITLKSDNLLIGGVGLHPPRSRNAAEGEAEIGYWLGRNYWGRGFASEAVCPVASIGFSRPTTSTLIATTAINNVASQNVLTKLGMRDMGATPRDYSALRGDNQVIKWQMTREEWQARNIP